jgi:NAD(P)-dependent dehydrogenase (short-subunit alcohol dehydrogenase family)
VADGNKRRVALVTGGSGGIGLAIAKALAKAGHDVAITARDAEKGADAIAEIKALGAQAYSVAMDVGCPDDVDEAVGAVTAVLGAPLVVVNNAGVAGAKPFHALTVEDWDEALAINARGPFLVTRACLPAMVERSWGRIISVASTAALEGVPYAAHYAASKHALLGLSRSLALEFARKGITANCVCPGFVETAMTVRSIENIVRSTGRTPEQARKALESGSPSKRLIQPEEVGAAVAYLASDAAYGVNGTHVVING